MVGIAGEAAQRNQHLEKIALIFEDRLTTRWSERLHREAGLIARSKCECRFGVMDGRLREAGRALDRLLMPTCHDVRGLVRDEGALLRRQSTGSPR